MNVGPGAILTLAASPPQTVEEHVLDVLAAGPRTSTELVVEISGANPETFRGREGCFFPLLLDLRRRGLVVCEWHGEGAGRRAFHRLAGDESTPRTPVPGALPSGRTLCAAAAEATDPLAFAPRLREETHAEILQHLAEASSRRRAAGLAPAAADKEALRAFGDPWKVGVDLARAAQGRRTVVFPSTFGDTLSGIAIYDLRVLLVIIAIIVFIRVQVVTAYHIPTKSMEPTLHGDPTRGDRILVNKLSGPPQRFDITVFDGFGTDRKNFVKRCVALPGEQLSLGEGDLWIDGKLVRKDGAAYEAMLFEVFDEDRVRRNASRHAKGEAAAEAEFREQMKADWHLEGGGEHGEQEDPAPPYAGFRLAVPDGADVSAPPPQITWGRAVEDSYVDPATGVTRPGIYADPDQRITAAVKPVPGTNAKVVFVLTRGEEHTYEAVLCGDGKGVRLLADGVTVGEAAQVTLPEGVPSLVSFSQVDRVLRLTVGGALVVRHDLPDPEHPMQHAKAGVAMMRVLRGAAWIEPKRLERDVYYVADSPERVFDRLGPDQFFMMGDNSSNSSDSRIHGPVHRSRLVGKPLLIVWPPSRMRVPR